VFAFEGFEFDAEEGRLTRGAETIDLQPKVADTLAVLLSRAGSLVRKSELFDVLWPDEAVQEGSLNQVVRKLRAALGDDQRQPRFIETVHRRGYRFVAAVATVDLSEGVARPRPPGPAAAAAAHPSAAATARPRRARLWLAVTAVAVLAAGGAVAVRLARGRSPHALEPGLMRLRRLTHSATRELEGDLSRDARTFVYSMVDPGSRSFDLYLGRVAGGSPVRLTETDEDESAPRLSPEGERIAFCRSLPDSIRSNVLTMAGLGGEERLVAERAQAPAWSPEGSELAYAAESAGGEWSVLAVTLGSGAVRTIVAGIGEEVGATAWSPDGRRIAYLAGGQLWVVDAAGGRPEPAGPLAEYMRQVAWHPAGRSLVCDANWGGRANLWLVPLDGGPVRPITAGSGGTYHPSVASSGAILYVQEQQLRRAVLVNGEGGEAAPLELPGVPHCPDAARTTGLVAYRNIDAGLNAESIVVVSPTGASLALAGPDEGGFGCPGVSRDGRTVAFASGAARDAISLCRSDGGACSSLRLPAGARCVGAPAWRRDDRELAVPVARAGAPPAVLLLDAGTGALVGPPVAALRSPAWSHDGRLLAGFSTDSGGDLEIVELASGTRRRHAGLRSFTAPPVWAPDDSLLTLLVDERRRPALVDVAPDGRVVRTRALAIAADPGLWGVFDARPLPDGWLLLALRYEGDLYLAEHRPDAG